MVKDPLLDNDFLVKLNSYQEREIYAKIISLDINENSIEEITGHVTQGSISLDGASAIRRTCSLTLIAENIDINDFYWGLNSKIKIFIGMKNFVDKQYDDIIWFPQGIFIINTFTTSQNTQGYTINIQGKDKMCLLNGDIGGNITSLSVDFGKIDEEDIDENGYGLGTYTTRDFLIKNIITEAVHTYASEPYHNIIVNDLDEVGLELLEYRGSVAMYLIISKDTNEVTQISFNPDQDGYYYIDDNDEQQSITLGSVPVYDPRNDLHYGETTINPTLIYIINNDDEKEYFTVCKITNGEVVGYRITDLTYAGDLIGSAGQSIVTAVLDPIVKQLGNFEYFYNTDGQFVFQKKKTYVNTSWNNIIKRGDEEYAENAAMTSSTVYSFEDSQLITAFNNNPDLSNVKNDYSIWGTKKGISGAEIPIHLRYAIDKKPIIYTAYSGQVYTTRSKQETEDLINKELAEKVALAEKYEKKVNPNGLSEDWWEIIDWAEYYSILAGHYPDGMIGNYANEGKGREGMEETPLEQYFGAPTDEDFERDPNAMSWQFRLVYIFDIVWRDYGKYDSAVIGYTGHGCGCGHKYTYFTDRASRGLGTSFIYKPTIPEKELQDIFQEEYLKLQRKINQGWYHFNCDWREIIYQMALDNLKNGSKDDFLAVIGSFNTEYYPTGITGYEQYYTDLIGFWRNLYNPQLNEVILYKFYKLPSNYTNAEWHEYVVRKKNLYIKDGEVYRMIDKKDYEDIDPTKVEVNRRIDYFIKAEVDLAETHPYTDYYYYDSLIGSYIRCSEEQVTYLNTPYSDCRYGYMKNGVYEEYYVYDKNSPFYEYSSPDFEEPTPSDQDKKSDFGASRG